MVESKDLILGIISFGMTLYGAASKDLIVLTGGIATLFITIYLNLDTMQGDIKELKAQINTTKELNKIWQRLDKLENEKNKK